MSNIVGGTPAALVSYHPNQKLAEAIVRAWKEPDYRAALLTFDDTYTLGQQPSPLQYAKTKAALSQFQIHLSKPVVLTPQQYAIGYQKVEDEVVFVLPNPLTDKGFELPGAEIAMAVTPLGM